MNTEFPRILTLLRKEKGLSQKQVAADMGISQALLSHYEKGIRECGLDFLVRISEYFDVSCDYLLGRTMQRKTAAVSADELPECDEIRHKKGNMINQINKKILMNSTTVIFDLLAQIGSKELTNAVSNYLMSAEYQVFRTVYCSSEHNSQSIFSLDKCNYKSLTSASMAVELEMIDAFIKEHSLSLSLSPDILSNYFEKGAVSLFNLVQYAEKNVRKITGVKL